MTGLVKLSMAELVDGALAFAEIPQCGTPVEPEPLERVAIVLRELARRTVDMAASAELEAAERAASEMRAAAIVLELATARRLYGPRMRAVDPAALVTVISCDGPTVKAELRGNTLRIAP